MINILQIQSLILWLQMFLIRDYHKPIIKADFDPKLSSFNKNELNKLKAFDFGHFIGKSHFEEDGKQNYLVFQPMYKYFKVFSITQYVEYVLEWKYKGLSGETIRSIFTSDNSLTPTLSYYDTK